MNARPSRTRIVARRLAALALACLACAASAAPELPLVRVAPSEGRFGPLVLLLTGDGDWVPFVRDLAAALAERGSPVLGVKSRSLLADYHDPDSIAAALEPVVRAELAARGRGKLVLIGYSRGADLAPFLVNRWPDDLRARVGRIVFIGLSERASFEFHLEDLVRDVARPTDALTRPEVERLGGIEQSCIYGAEERGSFCTHPVAGMRAVVHAGGHRATADGGVIELVTRELDRD